MEKRFYYPITSERMALRATARLWRYIAKNRLGKKPMTRWKNDCPCCEWSMHIGFMPCARCPLLGFWGARRPGYATTPGTSAYDAFNSRLCLCEVSLVSAYRGWLSVWHTRNEYYAQRIRWAALRKLYDRYSG